MKTTTCPFLGLKEDPTTSLSFPSPGNHCHHARPIAAVDSAHQEKFCLAANHQACPLYRAAAPVPMPRAMAAQPAPTDAHRLRLPAFALPFLLAGAALAVFVLGALGAGSPAVGTIPQTGQNPALQPLAEQPAVNNEALLPWEQNQPAVQEPKAANCPVPQGWNYYIVNPTDSLYRLSVVYNTSIQDFQAANCMGDQTLLLPGAVIFVPVLPTAVPTPTAVIYVAPALPPVAGPGAESTGGSGGSADPEPAVVPPQDPTDPTDPTPPPADDDDDRGGGNDDDDDDHDNGGGNDDDDDRGGGNDDEHDDDEKDDD